jgi:glycyl-tRNA synthetase beta chain
MLMSSRDLLFEIGTEEIPARFMTKALNDIRDYAEDELNSAHIKHGEVKVKGTPRRLVLIIKEVADSQEDSVELSKGPMVKLAFDADGNPTKAAEGFARGKGVAVSDLKRQTIGNAEYVFAEKRQKGNDTSEVMPSILANIINKLAFPKSMYWGDASVRFARPVRWLLALLGNTPVRVSFGSVVSGTLSHGHRFMGEKEFTVKSAADYENLMADNFVVIDPEARKQMVLDGIKEVEKELEARVEVDTALLEENVYLNEYPVVFYGSFDKEFLEIPEEVLTLSMAKNQRYFPVRSKNGKLMPYFVAVSNNKAKDMSVVREGNERVLRARLYDAAFFWKEDLQKPIDSMAEELKSVTYQAQLGSSYDKVQRVKALALRLADILNKNEIKDDVARAAELAKFDIVSSMVYEFSEVQGVMAREYARKAGEKEEVAIALYEQYLPRYAGDSLPAGIIGAIIGLADRADTIAGIFKIGLEPTSSQDPYGLRRAARCINEIIWGLGLDINTNTLITEAAKPLGLTDETLDKIYDFLKQRLQVQLKEKGLKHEVVALSLQTVPTRPLQTFNMSNTLQKVADEAWFGELITAAVRVKNILSKAEGEYCNVEIDETKLAVDAEKSLADSLEKLTVPASNAVKACDWEELTSILSKLAPVISKFFEDVLVMDKDESIRRNRLALLSKCQEFFLLVGDFSLLK